jgi:hypothetical protein
MGVISHQHESVNLTAITYCGLGQASEVSLVILSLEKGCLPIHAALNDMLRYAGNEISWLSGHNDFSCGNARSIIARASSILQRQKYGSTPISLRRWKKRFDPNFEKSRFDPN